MALNKELEIYENTTQNIGSQEDEIYDTVNLDQCESVTEGKDTRGIDEQVTPPSSIACKKHLQFILIGFLYAIVFACIFWNIYSEYNGKENLMCMKADIENTSKEREESSSREDDLKQEVTDYINTMYKDGLSELSKNVTDLEKQIKDSKTEKKVVAFNAMDAVSVIDDAITFKEVILNEGDAFNNDTGIFTAPVNGIYQFNAHICGKIEEEVEYAIKVENNVILTGEFRVTKEGSADTKCTSFSAAALVRKGEKVRVGGMSASDLSEVGQIDVIGSDLNSFSGTLIQTL